MKAFTILLTILLISCKSKTNILNINNSKEKNQKVILYNLNDKIPTNSKKLGVIKFGQNFITPNLDYDTLIQNAKDEAINRNGNAIKILFYKPLNTLFNNTTYLIKIQILKIDINTNNANIELKDSIKLKNYALIHLYRYSGGGLVNYKLHIGDSIINVKSNFKRTIKIKEEGKYAIWTKTEKRSEINLSVHLGREYYVKCGAKLGILIARPKLELMDSIIGKKEYNFFISKNN